MDEIRRRAVNHDAVETCIFHSSGTFSKFSDQKSYVVDKDDRYLYVIERCPVCWGRHAEKPMCHVATGLLQEGVKWVSGGKVYRIVETTCIAKGDPVCTFEINKEPIG